MHESASIKVASQILSFSIKKLELTVNSELRKTEIAACSDIAVYDFYRTLLNTNLKEKIRGWEITILSDILGSLFSNLDRTVNKEW